MRIISWKRGDRVVELEGNEPRMAEYADRLLDEGWYPETALRYAETRFGKASAPFYRWYTDRLEDVA